jgi:hypothetical protein
VKSSKEVLDYLSKSYEVIGKANGKGIMTYGKTSGYPTAIVGKHEAVIEPDKWLRIQNILDTKKETAYKKESKVYWLTQILKCPFCGSDYILVNSSYNCYYACSNRLRRNNRDVDVCLNNKYLNASEIESKIEELISLLASKNYKDFKESYNKDEIVFIDNSKEIEKSIIKNTKAIENLVEKLMLLSNAAAVPITAKIEELTLLNEKLKIQLEVEKLKRVESDLKQDNPSIIYDKILRFKDIKNAESKRVAVREIFAKLIYNPFEDSLTYEFI